MGVNPPGDVFALESFDPVTPQGFQITNLFWLELVISAGLMAVVIVWMVIALARFRARAGDATEPPQIHGNRNAELIWTITPAVTLAMIFVLTVQTMRSVEAAPSSAQPVRVIGHQWWWEYEFPDQQVFTANELHVPLGTPLVLNLQSVDVIHSFHVPQFGWMRDTVPGKTNLMPVTVVTAGTYDGACNQYCGLQHAWMRVIVKAEPPDQFNAWAQFLLGLPDGLGKSDQFIKATAKEWQFGVFVGDRYRITNKLTATLRTERVARRLLRSAFLRIKVPVVMARPNDQ